MTTTILASNNTGYGFHGTMGQHAGTAWPLAFAAIAEATQDSAEAVRWFLDSRYGRHFADDVLNRINDGHPLQDAISMATTSWRDKRISHWLCSKYGVPYRKTMLASYVAEYHVASED